MSIMTQNGKVRITSESSARVKARLATLSVAAQWRQGRRSHWRARRRPCRRNQSRVPERVLWLAEPRNAWQSRSIAIHPPEPLEAKAPPRATQPITPCSNTLVQRLRGNRGGSPSTPARLLGSRRQATGAAMPQAPAAAAQPIMSRPKQSSCNAFDIRGNRGGLPSTLPSNWTARRRPCHRRARPRILQRIRHAQSVALQLALPTATGRQGADLAIPMLVQRIRSARQSRRIAPTPPSR